MELSIQSRWNKEARFVVCECRWNGSVRAVTQILSEQIKKQKASVRNDESCVTYKIEHKNPARSLLAAERESITIIEFHP